MISEVPPSLAALPSGDLKPETFVSQLKEETGDSVLYQPFVIVGRLLEEGRHPCTQQKTPSSCAKRRKWSYFQVEKEEILYSEDSKKSKYDVRQKNSLVDCLVADLVSVFILIIAKKFILILVRYIKYIQGIHVCGKQLESSFFFFYLSFIHSKARESIKVEIYS